MCALLEGYSTMQSDALTLAAVAGELTQMALGARVEDVIQPTPQSIALLLYGQGAKRWLVVSAHPQLARIHLAQSRPRKMVNEPPAFVMLLRKHLEGARLITVRQPSWERVIELAFARGGPESGMAPVWLTAELMGRQSNVILREDSATGGEVLGALHTVPPGANRVRVLMPHVVYQPAPPQKRTLRGEQVPRLPPERATPAQLETAALDMLAATRESPNAESPAGKRKGKAKRDEKPTVVALLMAHVAGCSRELAREVAYRALGTTDDALAPDLDWAALSTEMRSLAALAESRAWRPTLVYTAPDAPVPDAFAVYEPRQFLGATLRFMTTVNEALATYYQDAEWRVTVEGAKGELRRLLQTNRERCQRKAVALQGELGALDEARRLREEADLLLAFQSDLPERATSVTLENPFASEPPTLTLELDPRYGVVENANRRYARYHKLQRAASQIPVQIAANELELARIEQLQADLALAETPQEIALVREEIVEAGYLRAKPDPRARKQPKGGNGKQGKQSGQQGKQGARGGTPLRRESSDGFALLVGKNSRQNEEVTFHQAAANDLWLHARGVPGAHVIVKSGGRPIPETTLHEAAALAAYYSQARESGAVEVDYTEQRYVRHMKGGGPGMVIYERERTLRVAPRDLASD
jgi:predicted ribosome quality control (RQC) complex YloA/Tae2 family protein